VAYRDRARQREAERRWYAANKRRVLDKKLAKKARIRALLRIAKEQPCTDCGRTYPYYVMDFDHISGTKVDIISRLAVAGSVRKLAAELEKCELVCANDDLRTQLELFVDD
jgi:hypothetical protein